MLERKEQGISGKGSQQDILSILSLYSLGSPLLLTGLLQEPFQWPSCRKRAWLPIHSIHSRCVNRPQTPIC